MILSNISKTLTASKSIPSKCKTFSFSFVFLKLREDTTAVEQHLRAKTPAD